MTVHIYTRTPGVSTYKSTLHGQKLGCTDTVPTNGCMDQVPKKQKQFADILFTRFDCRNDHNLNISLPDSWPVCFTVGLSDMFGEPICLTASLRRAQHTIAARCKKKSVECWYGPEKKPFRRFISVVNLSNWMWSCGRLLQIYLSNFCYCWWNALCD